MSFILSEETGYLIFIGGGLIMTVIVLLLIFIDTKWLGTRKTFEWFSTAGRSIKSGLLASSIISAWIWAATLLESSTVAYKYGIGGPFWYAAGASIQIIIFAVVALELKKRAPSSHTFTEFLYLRLGKFGHKVFLLFALATSLGLAGIAMHLDLSPLEVSHGLVAPITISTLLGEVGGILILTVLFTAVTCAGSAELVTFSSLFTFDVYRTYFKPSASGRQLMRISKYPVLMFGFGIGVLSLSLFHIGLSLQYIYLSMGILIGSAVGPYLCL